MSTICSYTLKHLRQAFKPGEAIFGSIGILLTIPDKNMRNHEAFIGLLEQMTQFLRRLGTLIVPDPDDAMMKIIVDILVELIRAFALLTERMNPSDAFVPMAKRRFRKVLAAVSGDKEVESMLGRLDELTKVGTRWLRRRHSVTSRSSSGNSGDKSQAERYQSWLSVPNSSTNQAIASEARHSDTSMWLVRGEVTWRGSQRHAAVDHWQTYVVRSLLPGESWPCVVAGAGKTVTCSTVIKDLQDSLCSSRPSAP
ncbi:hypothetical protein BC834DRAFT_629460 [Gloeopeniophorella convolvens]|nr:hypothetical protein BC834DRAFT_629460 [Gloeopeniophorella convolvens]